MSHPLLDLRPHRDTFPVQAAQAVLLDAIMEREVDLKFAAHTAIDVASYALGLWDKHEEPASYGSAPMNREGLVAITEGLINGNGADNSYQAVPWVPYALMLLQLAYEWLKRYSEEQK